MYWLLTRNTPSSRDDIESLEMHGRYVIHRHVDAEGEHLDFRIETGDCLVGWRVCATSLDEPAWSVEKAPHPTHWLEHDADAERQETGLYTWLERDSTGGVMLLRGGGQDSTVRVSKIPVAVDAVRALCETARELDLAPKALPGLVRDGMEARSRAAARLCGLGRELDGEAFDEGAWRDALAGMPLEGIQRHLYAYEVRFDQKYPPHPVSQPQALDDSHAESRGLAIALRDA